MLFRERYTSDAEWMNLATYLGGEGVAGGKMKETGYVHWNSPNTGATNESGFTAISGGYISATGYFRNLGNYTNFWSSSEFSSIHVWVWSLYYHDDDVGRNNSHTKSFGLSVRCLKD